ncbi:hypothetical protein CHH83_02075 [Bacillus sp. 7586-K]|nr:hypothetical protein CHH83_02075 [Bacillus sp. 7586-K]
MYLYTNVINGNKYKFIYDQKKPLEMKIVCNGKTRKFHSSISFSSLEEFNKYHDEFFKDKMRVKDFLYNCSITSYT